VTINSDIFDLIKYFHEDIFISIIDKIDINENLIKSLTDKKRYDLIEIVNNKNDNNLDQNNIYHKDNIIKLYRAISMNLHPDRISDLPENILNEILPILNIEKKDYTIHKIM
jgi:hypothetical protein